MSSINYLNYKCLQFKIMHKIKVQNIHISLTRILAKLTPKLHFYYFNKRTNTSALIFISTLFKYCFFSLWKINKFFPFSIPQQHHQQHDNTFTSTTKNHHHQAPTIIGNKITNLGHQQPPKIRPTKHNQSQIKHC